MSEVEQELTDDESFTTEPDISNEMTALRDAIKQMVNDTIIDDLEHIQTLFHEPYRSNIRPLYTYLIKRLDRISFNNNEFVPFIQEQIDDIIYDIRQNIQLDEPIQEDTQMSTIPEMDISSPEAQVTLVMKSTHPHVMSEPVILKPKSVTPPKRPESIKVGLTIQKDISPMTKEFTSDVLGKRRKSNIKRKMIKLSTKKRPESTWRNNKKSPKKKKK